MQLTSGTTSQTASTTQPVGTTYEYKVTTYYQGGPSKDTLITVTTPDPVNSPATLSAEVGARTGSTNPVSLSWTKPAFTSSFYVSYRPLGSTTWMQLTSGTTSQTASTTQPVGTTYEYKLTTYYQGGPNTDTVITVTTPPR
jgi:hypothetical protein